MKIKWTVAIDKVIEHRLKNLKKGERTTLLATMNDMYIFWDFRIDFEVFARVRLRVTNFGKFKKEVYG